MMLYQLYPRVASYVTLPVFLNPIVSLAAALSVLAKFRASI
jgi:hypothetical protein